MTRSRLQDDGDTRGDASGASGEGGGDGSISQLEHGPFHLPQAFLEALGARLGLSRVRVRLG